MELLKLSLYLFVFSLGIKSSFAASQWNGSYYCKSNEQRIDVTNTHLYIGSAQFKQVPDTGGSMFVFKEDVAVIMPIEQYDSIASFLFFKIEELQYNMKNNSNKYKPIANMICEID